MKNLLLLLLIAMCSGCAISKNVAPVDSNVTISKIYVLDNKRVHYENFVDELVTQIKDLGFESESYVGDKPKDALHYLTFTANWTWDIAMYLTYFRATIYEDGRVLGEAEYDSKMGGLNLSKFGTAKEKIRPLLQELLAKTKRTPGTS